MSNKKSITLTALGGLHERGKNLYLIETSEKEILIVDAGISYPGHDSPGVDYVFPEYQYLIDKIDRIKALVISSAYESHCGGAHHLINKCNIKKVIGSKLALNLIKLELDQNTINSIEWIEFENRSEITAAQFKILPIRVTASCSEAYAAVIEANGMKIFYTGSFKLDQTPLDGIKTDMVALSNLSEKNIDLYLGNSISSEKDGYSKSELDIYGKLKSTINSYKGRIILNTYTSNTVRLKGLLMTAAESNRKIALLNREAREYFNAAKASGCLDYDESNLISIKEIDNYKDNELLIISAAPEDDAIKEIEKMAFDRSLEIQIRKGDLVINSADLPPGTVRTMAKISDELFLKEVKIIGGREAGVHVDSHAAAEELKFMFNLIRPKFFIPVMGETRQLIKHAQLAVESGFDPGAVLIINNGDQVQVTKDGINVGGRIEVGDVLFNDSQDFHVDNKIVKERDNLAKEGVVTVCFSINKKKKVVSGPLFSARACTFSNNKEWRAFCLMNSQDLIDAIENLGDENPKANIDDFQDLVREHMNSIIKNQIGKKPSVIVLASEV